MLLLALLTIFAVVLLGVVTATTEIVTPLQIGYSDYQDEASFIIGASFLLGADISTPVSVTGLKLDQVSGEDGQELIADFVLATAEVWTKKTQQAILPPHTRR